MKFRAIVGGLTLALLITGSAFAATGGNSGNGTSGSINGNGKGTATVQYKSSYTDPFFGPVRCTGVHQSGKTTLAFAQGQDSFTCTSTSGLALTNVTSGEALSLSTFSGWISDYFLLLSPPQTVYATSFSGTVSSDGFSYTAVAGY
jgi:hypothetical protein